MGPKPVNVLVTGGLGVIGSAVVRHFLTAGDRVFVIDAAEEPRNLWVHRRLRADFPDGVLLVGRARLESYDLKEWGCNADLIVHAAAHTGIPHSAEDPTDDWTSNVDATRHLLEEMRRDHIGAPTVLMSSVKPYRVDEVPKHGVDESFQLEPDEPYAASKLAQSALGLAYARTYGLPITVLRFSNLYGPAPCHGPRHGWLTWFCIAGAIGRSIQVQGNGSQVRDMLYSDDVVSALVRAAECTKTTAGNVYNVGGGERCVVSVRTAAEYVAKRTGVQITEGPGRKNEDMEFWTNFHKFTQATGWRPNVDVKTGIDRVLDWAQANRSELRFLYEGV